MDLKYIHLLYVPTMACNMACKYCYLDETSDLKTKYNPLDTLSYAIDKFKKSNVIPFNISLHGGEVTTLSKKDFHDVIQFIYNYYKDNKDIIEQGGFKVGYPHIKTNLYDLDKHIETIKKFNVSISGSLDLPLSLHDTYRVTKGNKKTLDKILDNIKLLDSLPNSRKVSSTIFKEHYEKIDEIIKDIWFLYKNTTLDMNDFNFMIGFDYNSNGILHPLSEKEQVKFYNRMKKEFTNTELDKGLNGAWFNEFGPGYCTNCTNCGSKFFLLEKNGDIYSCVRGQKNKDFYYGNIYKDSVEDILNNAYNKIYIAHNKQGFSEECGKCKYLYLCKTGCPYVKNIYKTPKSYTCLLQQQLYKDRNYDMDEELEYVFEYVKEMQPNYITKYMPPQIDKIPRLDSIILDDDNLKYIYDPNIFILNVDGIDYKLESQILKNKRDFIFITKESVLKLYIKKEVLDVLADYPINNSLYIQLLSGDMVTYGDEHRTKQKHIMNQMIYKSVLEDNKSDRKGYYFYDITSIIKEYSKYLSSDKANNIFFTTSALRDYHYTKQKQNAYYHINAINLPFQNIEFYLLGDELDEEV